MIYDPNFQRKIFNGFSSSEKYLLMESNRITYLVNVNDHIGYKMYVNGFFDESVIQVASIFDLKENDIFLDIGANIGSICLPIAEKFSCTCVAIEASKINGWQLLRNAVLNPQLKIIPFILAVGDKEFVKNQMVELNINPGNLGANSLLSNWNIADTSENVKELVKPVMVDSLVKIINFDNIKFIKLDVEGFEINVIKGMNNLIDKRIPIIFEWRVDLSINPDDQILSLQSLLGKNYDFHKVCTSESGNIYFSKFDPAIKAENVLALDKDSDFKNEVIKCYDIMT